MNLYASANEVGFLGHPNLHDRVRARPGSLDLFLGVYTECGFSALSCPRRVSSVVKVT